MTVSSLLRGTLCGAFLFSFGLVAGAGAVQAAPAKAQVYLLGGQSNMQGKGKLADLPADFGTELEGVFFWNRQREFEPVIIGKSRTSARTDEFGPELAFARTLRQQQPDVPVYLLKYFASGKAIDRGWDGPVWAGDKAADVPDRKNFHPGDKPDDPNVGFFYPPMVKRFSDALAALKKSGIDYEVVGIVWVQGEQDARSTVSAGRYAENLARLKRRLEQDLGLGELPMVFSHSSRIPDGEGKEARFHYKLLWEQKEKADSRSGDALAIAKAYLVPIDKVTFLEDGIHYDATGQLRVGEDLARMMLEAKKFGK